MAGISLDTVGANRYFQSPTGIRHRHSLVGRRQVVRLWILIPAFVGSNPTAPAIHKLGTPAGRLGFSRSIIILSLIGVASWTRK